MSDEPVKHNFSKVSARDAIAFASTRPGFPSKEATREEVEEWAQYMRAKGVRRVLSLLGTDESDFYKGVDVDDVMIEQFGSNNYTRLSVFSPNARSIMSAAMESARKYEVPIVMHCSGGEGRAALAMGLWLVDGYGLAPEDAAREIQEEAARNLGVARKPNAEKLAYLVLNGTMTGYKK